MFWMVALCVGSGYGVVVNAQLSSQKKRGPDANDVKKCGIGCGPPWRVHRNIAAVLLLCCVVCAVAIPLELHLRDDESAVSGSQQPHQILTRL